MTGKGRSMNKKLPQRTCIGCGSIRDKASLIRIVRGTDGVYSIDRSGRKNGRGAYFCDNVDCLEMAIRKKALNRSFREAVPEEAIRRIRREWDRMNSE